MCALNFLVVLSPNRDPLPHGQPIMAEDLKAWKNGSQKLPDSSLMFIESLFSCVVRWLLLNIVRALSSLNVLCPALRASWVRSVHLLQPVLIIIRHQCFRTRNIHFTASGTPGASLLRQQDQICIPTLPVTDASFSRGPKARPVSPVKPKQTTPQSAVMSLLRREGRFLQLALQMMTTTTTTTALLKRTTKLPRLGHPFQS